jgi:hypothetical protein
VTARSFERGHPTEFDSKLGWVYSDTKVRVRGRRPCTRCGRRPTKEGHDACLGTIKGVKSACCGHGVEKPYVKKENES